METVKQDKDGKAPDSAVKDVAEAPPFAVPLQILRGISAVVFVLTSCLSIHSTQVIGYPIKLFSPELYHAWIDITKQNFCYFLTTLIQFWTPVAVEITGDRSMEGLFTTDAEGNLVSKFGDKAILMSNHQLYVDWAYMWWTAFTAKAHGGVFIILKASLKNLPVIGWGMQIYRFIFLTRKWSKDEKILKDGLSVISQDKQWPTWLLLFPEGTTMSRDGYNKTVAFAKKADKKVPDHVLLPRATGLRYSLLELNSSIEYLYDATIHYDGVPEGEYGEDYFTLRSMYLRGHYPKKVHMYWRRFRVSEIPYGDEKEFEQWIYDRWYEKDQLLDSFITSGEWTDSGSVAARSELIEPVNVKVKLRSVMELFQIFSVPLNIGMIGSLLYKHLWPLVRGAGSRA